MVYNSVIPQKCVYYINYINNNGLYDKLFDPSKNSVHCLNTYLTLYFLFQKSGVSYDLFYEIIKYGVTIGSNNDNYPKKTALHTFKNKLSKLNLHNIIHNEHIGDVLTEDCSIDSTNIISQTKIILF